MQQKFYQHYSMNNFYKYIIFKIKLIFKLPDYIVDALW